MRVTYFPKPKDQQGFTIIEVIVTLIIVSLFLTIFFQSYMLMETQRIKVARQAVASDLAYSNLRLFPTRPSGLTCSANIPPLIDATTSTTPHLGTNSRQTVTASAPHGCDGSDFRDGIVKIESVVTYGNGSDEVVHASYVR